MEETSSTKRASRREHQSRRRSWCCSFSVPPSSPENLSISRSKAHHSKSEILSKPSNSVPNSPQSSKSGLGIVGRIDPRRILSPGRVSPIDSDPTVDSIHEIGLDPSAIVESPAPQRSESFRAPSQKFRGPPECSSSANMDRRCLILISTLFVQSLYGASIEVPSTTINGDATSANTFNGTPLENFSNLTPGDAQVLADLQRIRLSGERFRGEAMQFIQSLPNRLSEGFAQSHQLFQLLAQMFSSAVNDRIQTIQAGGRYLGENAKNLALEGLKRGQNGISAGVEMGEKVLERVRSNGQALLQNGMSYLQSGGSGSASITTRDLSDQITAPFDNQYTQQFTSSLKNAANTVTSQLPNPNQQLEDEDDALYRAQTQDDPEDDLDFDDGLESQKLARRDDKPVTGVLSDEISGVGAAGADMFKNVARFTSGGIRGLLDALSTVLVTTGEVGGHARSAFSSINKSGAGAISAVIDTGGNIVSGGLDKAGSVVGSLKVGGGGATPPKA